MRQNDAPKPFRWDARKEAAAALLAEDHLTDEEIAGTAGCSRAQLARWKVQPEFAARVREVVKALGDRSLQFAVARRHRRVAELQDALDRLRRVIRERAADPRLAGVPGGASGLIVIKESEVVPAVLDPATGTVLVPAHAVPTEVALDAALVREWREVLKQAAQEVGQWTEKREVSGAGGKPISFLVIESGHGESPDRADDGEGGADPQIPLPPGPA